MNHSSPSKICIVGAGGMGTLFAVPLCLQGHQVSVLTRGATHERLGRDGMALRRAGDSLHARPRVCRDARELGPQTLVVLAVKAGQLGGAVQDAVPLVSPDTTVLTLSNGLPWWFFEKLPPTIRKHVSPVGGETSRDRVSAEQVLGALVYINVSAEVDGTVAWNGGERIVVGPSSPSKRSRGEEVVGMLRGVGFQASLSPYFEREMWDKLVGNAVLNPLSVIAKRTIGEMMADGRLREVAVSAMREIELLGARLGVEPLRSAEERVAALHSIYHCYTSMWHDFSLSRETELDAFSRPLLEMAKALDLEMSVTRDLWNLCRAALMRSAEPHS